MLKTIEIQIEKSRSLIKGLRKYLSEGGKGVEEEELIAMEQSIEELKAASDQYDRLKAELSAKSKNVNEIMAQVKNTFGERKLLIKNNYPQESWVAYGIPDKR